MREPVNLRMLLPQHTYAVYREAGEWQALHLANFMKKDSTLVRALNSAFAQKRSATLVFENHRTMESFMADPDPSLADHQVVVRIARRHGTYTAMTLDELLDLVRVDGTVELMEERKEWPVKMRYYRVDPNYPKPKRYQLMNRRTQTTKWCVKCVSREPLYAYLFERSIEREAAILAAAKGEQSALTGIPLGFAPYAQQIIPPGAGHDILLVPDDRQNPVYLAEPVGGAALPLPANVFREATMYVLDETPSPAECRCSQGGPKEIPHREMPWDVMAASF